MRGELATVHGVAKVVTNGRSLAKKLKARRAEGGASLHSYSAAHRHCRKLQRCGLHHYGNARDVALVTSSCTSLWLGARVHEGPVQLVSTHIARARPSTRLVQASGPGQFLNPSSYCSAGTSLMCLPYSHPPKHNSHRAICTVYPPMLAQETLAGPS